MVKLVLAIRSLINKLKIILVHPTAYYSITVVLGQAMTVLSRLITNNILGPELVGMLAHIDLVRSYSMYFTSPFRSVIDMEMPIIRGKRDSIGEQNLISQSLMLSIVVNLIFAIGVAVFSLFTTDATLQTVFFIFCVTNVFFQLFSFYQILLRNFFQFKLLCIAILINTIIVNILSVYGAAEWGLIGYLTAQGIGMILLVLWLISRRLFPIGWNFDRETFRLIVFKGSWIGLGGIFYGILLEIDRTIVIATFPNKEIGYYSLVFLLIANLLVIVNTINATFIPIFLQSFGNGTKLKAIAVMLMENIIQRTFFFSLIIIILYILIPAVIPIVLPSFTPGIPYAQDSMIRILPLALVSLASTIFSACNRNKAILKFSLVGIIFGGCAIWCSILLNGSLYMVTWVVNAFLFLFGTIVFISSSRLLNIKWYIIIGFVFFLGMMMLFSIVIPYIAELQVYYLQQFFLLSEITSRFCIGIILLVLFASLWKLTYPFLLKLVSDPVES
ncbi:hypothetical protein SPSIL_042780 [Sporomusa silvacetica DSM 10669]|uniref:Polysaccharide biosynthesis protein n=1 Tax=Sporomusa silvacetica DSM 10669 TaxID=1123289 RepID=A0ABZ3IRJ7_9FIRM|nr:hypothetical protein [Sporomusa silvacetica]OZC20539.1 polysaccharide biosynthesis protein [Sporomusa silvacetica DSM 10669]